MKLLERGSLNGELWWVYTFSLDGSLAQEVVVGRTGFLKPRTEESFVRLEPDLIMRNGEIGEGFLLGQRQKRGVFIALGYIGWDERPVFGSCALNFTIEGFKPPRNFLVLYKRDILWLKRLRDKKTMRARDLAFARLRQEVGRGGLRDAAINAANEARRKAIKETKEKRQKILANLQAVCTTLKLERMLEPIWGFKVRQKLWSLERRVAALEIEASANDKGRTESISELAKQKREAFEAGWSAQQEVKWRLRNRTIEGAFEDWQEGARE